MSKPTKSIYFLNIQNSKYNLGALPNILIGKYIHNISLPNVLEEYMFVLKERTANTIYKLVDECYLNLRNKQLHIATKNANMILEHLNLVENIIPLVEFIYYRAEYFKCIDEIYLHMIIN